VAVSGTSLLHVQDFRLVVFFVNVEWNINSSYDSTL